MGICRQQLWAGSRSIGSTVCLCKSLLGLQICTSVTHIHPAPSATCPTKIQGQDPKQPRASQPFPSPGLFAELRNQHQLLVWKKTLGEEKTQEKASLAREGLLGSAFSRSPFNSASFAWTNRCRWRSSACQDY